MLDPVDSRSHSQANPTPRERSTVWSLCKPRPVRPGVYDGRVVDASTVSFAWRKTETNPHGLTLRVFVEVEADDGTAHVGDAVDVDHVHRLREMFASCGLTLEAGAAAEDIAHELIGKPCRVVLKNIAPRQGKHAGQLKACVSGWL
jgi:hypothetical protein